jgi:hypothetical protein
MTAKPVLSEEETNHLLRLLHGGLSYAESLEYINILIRAHVVKALDGIELPKEENEYGEAESEREIFNEGFNTCLVEVKMAIQKSKEAYL